MDWVDTHCHLQYDGIPAGALERAAEAGVQKVICIGTDAAQSQAAIDVAASAPGRVWATIGVHPHEAKLGTDGLLALLGAPRVVGIGECGLDYFYDHSPREEQRAAFAAQVALARVHDLTLVIHTRDAWDDTFAILDAEGPPERIVFHCFTGGRDEARRALDTGAYLSFSGIATFKKADDVRAAAKLCPSSRVLVETDAPYLTPEPHRGTPNEPAFVAVVGRAVAQVRGEDPEQFAAVTTANSHTAFRLS